MTTRNEPNARVVDLPDKGCAYYPVSCFSCPFTDCLVGMPAEQRRRELSLRDEPELLARLAQLVDRGMTPIGAMAQIDASDGVALRTRTGGSTRPGRAWG